MTTDFDANVAEYSLESSQEHTLGEFNFSLDVLVHLIYLFALGVPAYRIRWYVSVSLCNHRASLFRVLRQSIYDDHNRN